MNRRNYLARVGLALVPVLAAATVLAGCGSSPPAQPAAASASNAANAAAEANPNLDLGSSLGNAAAPDVKLTNQFGQPMSLSQFRGRVVILAFSDSECTTVCPLTTQSMVLAKELLGKAGENVQLIGVDANPDATSVADVMSYSRAHGMVNQWDFLTGSVSQLRATWNAYHIAVQIDAGQIDHTPALYVISQRGTLEKVYLTQMAYSSVAQSAQVLATEVSALLPGHPKLASQESLAAIPGQTPSAAVSIPAAAGAAAPSVNLGPGKPRLVVFFATWLTETSDLKAQLTGLNAYAKAAAKSHLPALTAVDETVTEPSAGAVRAFLGTTGTLDYPVGLDTTGRLADGYGVQDQPWLVLVSAAGKIVWSHDGWLPPPSLEKAAATVGG
ncbi:MAG TPA: SCO family protein [Trebonia sp.]|nr:SCO family protein [Trebonia sp.]